LLSRRKLQIKAGNYPHIKENRKRKERRKYKEDGRSQ
jgi:hypothetical protein